MLKTPIIFLIFNRPKETAAVWNEIKKAQPAKLFIVADGPRTTEERNVTDSVRAVVENIDWECEVHRNYSEKNLGCRERVWSGLDWAFDQLKNDTDGAIVLEDDCLPEQSFFLYCEEMLEKYKDESKIMHIGGVNFQNEPIRNSYYFSRIAQIWGWATWKRAWKLYDGSLTTWPAMRDSYEFASVFPNRVTHHYWRHMFDRIHNDEMNTWDVAWTYTCFKQHGLCIMPSVNLIENIGSNTSATHKVNKFVHQKTSPLIFPLTHPSKIEVHESADQTTYIKIFGIKNSFRNKSVALMKDKLPFLHKYIKLLVK